MLNSEELRLMLGEKPGTKRVSQQIGTCPSCSREVKIRGRITIGMTLQCSACGDELQVIETDPIELDWLYDDDGDFYDDQDW